MNYYNSVPPIQTIIILRHISDGFPVPAIAEICLGGMDVLKYDLVFEPRIHVRSSHVILHRKRDIFAWSL